MTTQVGDYELERQIGAGAAGAVWRAHRRGPVPQVVALKRLRAGSSAVDLAAIRREAVVLTELDHPHIVRVLDVLHDGEGVALAMQLAPGGSLDALLAERGRLAPGAVVAVAAPVADALMSAHRRGVLHGDVKPANILFTSDGEPLLTDFGVARTLDRVTSDQITGTAEYLAPELLDGGPPDRTADVYALAVVCYEALAGRPPYVGSVPLAVVRAAETADHRSLDEVAGIPGTLAEVVERGMARRPDDRFPSAEAFAGALRDAVPAGDVRVPGTAAVPAAPAAAGGTEDGGGASDGRTHDFGPRPPRSQPDPPRERRRVPRVALVGLVAAGLVFLVRGPLGLGDTDDTSDGCPEPDVPSLTDGGQVIHGDTDGRGCTAAGTYTFSSTDQRMVLDIPVGGEDLRVGIGQRGDQLLLGDWDCDGTDTPGLYRPGAGQIQYFDAWPTANDEVIPDVTASSGTGGTAAVHEVDPGDADAGAPTPAATPPCDEIVVTPAAPPGSAAPPQDHTDSSEVPTSVLSAKPLRPPDSPGSAELSVGVADAPSSRRKQLVVRRQAVQAVRWLGHRHQLPVTTASTGDPT